MMSSKLLKLLVPAAVVVEAAQQSKEKNDLCCRPSELPIYTKDSEVSEKQRKVVEQSQDGILEEYVRKVRTTFTDFGHEVKAYERVGLDYLNEGKENVQWVVNYLQEENNTLPKAGAIAIGGLTGYIFGLRGRFFKRTLYTTIGALGMASICYPKQAAQYSQVALRETKKYLTIGYNFVYGVKKGDEPLELPSLPKLPTNFSDAWDSVKSSVTSFVSDGGSSPQMVSNVKQETESKK